MIRIRSPFRAAMALGSIATFVVLAAAPDRARAAEILFVADSDGDADIATALRADGHTVTTVTRDFASGSNPGLRAPLGDYDAVFWSADGTGSGSAHTDTVAFANLSNYVSRGGRVFVTGYDSIASPTDPALIAFLGGTGSTDDFASPGAIVSVESSLTVGVADIRGVTPSGGGDNDCLRGFSGTTGTALVAASGSDTTCAQWSLRRLDDGEIAYVSNGTGAWSTTGGGAAGAYNAAIRNFAAASDFSMADEGAPVITFDSPMMSDEGDDIEVTVLVEDLEGDIFSYSWDLDDDGEFGERADTFDHTVSGETDGPGSVRVGVRAVDEHGNTSTRYRTLRVVNVEPRIASAGPTFVSVGVDLAHQVEVEDPGGALDPITYTLVRGPSRMNVNDTGLVSWVPNETEVTLAGETVAVEISVDDGDGGTDSQTFELVVSPNRQPTPPMPSFPADAIAIIDRVPRLAAQNGEDADLDPLTYAFQIDTVDTFDSEDLREIEGVEETPGFTAWYLTEPLREDVLYHWRVRANDGLIDSEWRQTRFYVVRDPSLPPPDAGASDAGPGLVDAGGMIPSIDAGVGGGDGGCSASARRSSTTTTASLFTFVLGALFVARRRRQRNRA